MMTEVLKRMLAATAATLLAAAAPAAAQELVVGAANVSAYIDPGKDHSNVGSQQYINSFETLIHKDATKSESVWQPGLATEWKLVTPQLMELKIRKGVKFHNGDEMTIDDVVFSLERMLNPAYPPYVVRSRDFFGNLYRVEAVDDETLRVYAKQSEPLFETLMNVQQGMIVPKKYIMGMTGHPDVDETSDYDAFGLAPVGTGPYKVVEYVPGEKIVWERFDDYWGDKAPYQKITLRRIPELSSRITALKNGEVDIVTNIPPDAIAAIESDEKLKVEGMVTPLFHVVIFNAANEKMPKKLRQALAHAIDRDTLNEALWLGKAVVPSTHTYPQYGELYMPELKTWEYDPEKAKQLLAESGYDGYPIRFDTSAVYYTNGLLAAQAIKEMWAAIGVETEIKVDDKWTGTDPTMMARNWSNPMYFPDPAGSFGTMWAPDAASKHEGRFLPTEEYKEIWNRFRFSTDAAERRKAFAELMDYIKDDMPVVVLYQPYESYGMRAEVSWKPQPGHIPYVLDFRAGMIKTAQN